MNRQIPIKSSRQNAKAPTIGIATSLFTDSIQGVSQSILFSQHLSFLLTNFFYANESFLALVTCVVFTSITGIINFHYFHKPLRSRLQRTNQQRVAHKLSDYEIFELHTYTQSVFWVNTLLKSVCMQYITAFIFKALGISPPMAILAILYTCIAWAAHYLAHANEVHLIRSLYILHKKSTSSNQLLSITFLQSLALLMLSTTLAQLAIACMPLPYVLLHTVAHTPLFPIKILHILLLAATHTAVLIYKDYQHYHFFKSIILTLCASQSILTLFYQLMNPNLLSPFVYALSHTFLFTIMLHYFKATLMQESAIHELLSSPKNHHSIGTLRAETYAAATALQKKTNTRPTHKTEPIHSATSKGNDTTSPAHIPALAPGP